jgi:hypothetical protein
VADGARRDPSQDDAAGGHILQKRVGGSHEQLRARPEQERRMSAALSHSDRAAAEFALGSVRTATAGEGAALSAFDE